MAVVTSGSWQKSLLPAVDVWFNDKLNAWESEHKKIFKIRQSKRAFEQAVGMSLLGLASVKDQGASLQYDDTQQTYINNFVHDVRALGTIITLEAYRDNQYSLDALSEKPQALADSMNETKEVDHANVLNNAFDSGYTMGASSDGKELCNSAHPNGPYGATQSNILAAADLSETSLEDICIQIDGFKDPRGLQQKITPQTLLIPRQLRFTASRILDSTLQNDNASNAINALKSNNTLPGGYMVNHYLTDTDAFFVLSSVNETGKGLVSYDAWPLEFGQDNEFDTFNLKVKAFYRDSKGWIDWRCICGSAGA